MSKDKTQAGKQLAPAKENRALALANAYDDYVDQGFENQTREDMTIPFLGVLQGLSPQLETIDGAKPGLLFNTVTNELYPDGVVIVPAMTQHVFVEWKPRNSGGGFVAVHSLDSDVVRNARENQQFGEYKSGDNELIETFYIYGVQLDKEGMPVAPITLAFTATKIKPYKRWSSAVQMFLLPAREVNGRVIRPRPPMFAHRVRVTTVKEKNQHGEYHNFVLQPAVNLNIADSLLAPDSPAFQAAEECYHMVSGGQLKADYNAQDTRGSRSEAPDGGKAAF